MAYAPILPARFGCRGARRTKWGYLPRETKATDGTFGEVAQTIPPSYAHGGEAAGSWRNLTLANMGVASFRLGRRTSPFGYLSFAPKVLRGSKGNFFKSSPWRVPPHLPDKPKFESLKQTAPKNLTLPIVIGPKRSHASRRQPRRWGSGGRKLRRLRWFLPPETNDFTKLHFNISQRRSLL